MAFVFDVFSRRILGWRAATTMTTPLVLDCLEQAIWTRRQSVARAAAWDAGTIGRVLSAHGGFDWLGSSTPWWVTPGVTLLAVYLTARATTRQGRRTERRTAVVTNRRTLLRGFGLEPTGSRKSYTPDDQDLELALIQMGFTRSQTWDLTRRLWDHRSAEEDLKRLQELSLLEMTVMAVSRSSLAEPAPLCGGWRPHAINRVA